MNVEQKTILTILVVVGLIAIASPLQRISHWWMFRYDNNFLYKAINNQYPQAFFAESTQLLSSCPEPDTLTCLLKDSSTTITILNPNQTQINNSRSVCQNFTLKLWRGCIQS